MRRAAAFAAGAALVAFALVGVTSLVWPVVAANGQWRPIWSLDDDYLSGRELAQAQPSGRQLYCDALAEAKYGKRFSPAEPGNGPAQDQIAFQMGCEDVADGLGNRVSTLGSRLQ